ncbi:MAG: YicC/YloC family endoribonuclease [Pseudomonadota bacterium]
MIRSMTAYARTASDTPLGTVTWELRTVNNRYLDQSLRLPEDVRALDSAIRERVSGRLKRGKLDCTLKLQSGTQVDAPLNVNLALAEQVAAACAAIGKVFPETDPPGQLEVLRWPGVIEAPPVDLDAAAPAVLASLDQALDELVSTREREGARLDAMLQSRLETMSGIVDSVQAGLPGIVEAAREKLKARLAEVSGELDPQRVEQEIVFFAQKIDVAEELDRLRAHIDEVRAVLGRDEPVGRRLDFLMQELNREANTLGSKSVDTVTTRASVDLKVLIEQMREQVQNIE